MLVVVHIRHGSSLDEKGSCGLLLSLNTLIEALGGFDYTGAHCQQCLREVGLRGAYVRHPGPDSMVVAIS